ncbi:low temperature requirement protein A [Halosolutus gelatinilyticus]|uniref:low temperature requirement protein A n=1 Tax=Halosolutus gelatinilyticus TaxID=2931975 RepID=UPI003CE4F283
MWLTHVYYGDVFDTGDLLYSVTTLLAMFGVLLWLTTFSGVFHGRTTVFVFGYLTLRIVNALSCVLLGWIDSPQPGSRIDSRSGTAPASCFGSVRYSAAAPCSILVKPREMARIGRQTIRRDRRGTTATWIGRRWPSGRRNPILRPSRGSI